MLGHIIIACEAHVSQWTMLYVGTISIIPWKHSQFAKLQVGYIHNNLFEVAPCLSKQFTHHLSKATLRFPLTVWNAFMPHHSCIPYHPSI